MKKDKEFGVKVVNFIIIAVLLFLLFNALSCEDDDCYTDMHVIPKVSWDCYQRVDERCKDIDFPTEEQWLEEFGRVWEVRCEYADMTIGKFHYIPTK